MSETSVKSVSFLYNQIYSFYEIANSFFTFGLDLYWRKKASIFLKNKKNNPNKILDVCCGTGDFSLSLLKVYPNSSITASDLNEKMLFKAKQKTNKINFILADSAKLPFEDETFDIVTISFATRNLALGEEYFINILKEFLRVLKKDGLFLNLESTVPENKLLAKLMYFYVKATIGLLILFFPKTKKSYNFLMNSVLNFYKKKDLANIILKAGFTNCQIKTLFPGSCAIHLAKK